MNIIKRKSFSLVELIIVMVIISILASIVVPAVTSIKATVVCTEAVSMMGLIRAGVRNYYTQYGFYPAGGPRPLWDEELIAMGINKNDLNGMYFSEGCYLYENLSGNCFRILCYPNISTAPKAAETKNLLLAQDFSDGGIFGGPSLAFAFSMVSPYCLIMYYTGKIAQSGIPKSGYPQDDGTA